MYFASNNVFINLILRGSDFWLCTIQVTKHIIAISNLHTAKKKGAPKGFMPVSALSLKWWRSCKWWLLRKIGKQRLVLTQTVISIAPLCLVPVQRKDSLFSQGSYPGQPMLPGAGLGSEAGDRVWNAKTKIKPEDCSPVLDRLVIHRPDHADCSRISYLSRQVFCCAPTKMLFHSPLSRSFPGQSSCYTGRTHPAKTREQEKHQFKVTSQQWFWKMPWMHRHSHLLRYVHGLKALCAVPKSSRPAKDSCGKALASQRIFPFIFLSP